MARPAATPEIIVGVGASIAAYKAADVVSGLKKKGAGVTVLLTPRAVNFVAPLTLKVLSGRPVGLDLFDEPAEWGVGHVTLAKRAAVFVIVGATADLLARLDLGLADDFVTTCALAYAGPLVIAPAMNTVMWAHPATRAHVRALKARGARFIEPVEGLLACGDIGAGKLADPADIVEMAWSAAQGRSAGETLRGPLVGKRILVTAGPTREALDPVRYLSNPSSGKMGFAVAEACRDLGAQVTLVSGPVGLVDPAGIEVLRVENARQMLSACVKVWPKCQALVAAAAVSDFRPEKFLAQKKKKGGQAETLRLAPNPDILASLAKSKGKRVLVGFAAETENLLAYARQKLTAKKLDLVVANLVGQEGSGFASDDNQASFVTPDGQVQALEKMSKQLLGRRVAEFLAEKLT